MSLGSNRWKLGLFVIVGIALSLATLVVFGARKWNDKTVSYFSFFDESVQGLELGSPVKFRGVTIGRVAAIDVAPDHRHVQVESQLFVEQLDRLALGDIGTLKGKALVQSKLRVQLGSTGITGVKFILIDFFETAEPSEKLPFEVPPNTIATTPSTMKNLEDSVVRATDQFPDIAVALLATITKLNGLLDGVAEQNLPARASGTLGETNAAMRELRVQLAALNAAGLSAQADRSLSELGRTLESVNRVLTRLERDDGIMKGAERAANSLNEVARGAQGIGPEAQDTLREVRGAARSLRRFLDALERDPDMLLKGRAAAER
jgi:ABC-type transporter Mla subunit MlaD